MQTFLPHPDFTESARTLDRQRLGKQRVEALQILNTLLGLSTKGWANHPATLMWRGHELVLLNYLDAICDEWAARGYKDTCRVKANTHAAAVWGIGDSELAARKSAARLPSWIGDPDFHRSHQSNLVRKDPAHYGPQFPGVPDDLEYVWPSRLTIPA